MRACLREQMARCWRETFFRPSHASFLSPLRQKIWRVNKIIMMDTISSIARVVQDRELQMAQEMR